MLQSGGCYSGARAPELVRHFAKLYGSPQDPADLIALLGLDALGRTTYRRMSGGERARLSLALSIVGRPELVFLDEPSAGLDPQARLVLWDLIAQLQAAGVTVVLTTHQLDEAERLADDIVIITDGQVRRSAALADLVAGGEPVITFRTVSDLDLNDLLLLLGPTATALRSAPDTYVISGRADPIALAMVATWAAEHRHPLRELSMGNRGLAARYLEIVGAGDGS
jgi:ABC-2 type transport system ATP-binding protein